MLKILSFDGGGIRGLLTARILERVDAERPGWLRKADMVAGTSTGGILALAVAQHRMTPSDMVDLYRTRGADIFASRGFLDDLSMVDELIRANYGQDGLRGALQDTFGDATMGSLVARAIIPTFDLGSESGRWQPRFTDSSKFRDKCLPLVDAALMTSAAPTYFPSHMGCVDGGMFANNPADCALASAMHDGHASEEIMLCSIGTGFNRHSIDCEEDGMLDWGLGQWAPKLLSILMEGSVSAASYRVRQTIGDRFFRIDPALPRIIDLADVSAIDELLEVANTVDIGKLIRWLDDMCW